MNASISANLFFEIIDASRNFGEWARGAFLSEEQKSIILRIDAELANKTVGISSLAELFDQLSLVTPVHEGSDICHRMRNILLNVER